MKARIAMVAGLSALTLVLSGGCSSERKSEAVAGTAPGNEQVAIPLKSVPTFSSANIARIGHFYVGGKWMGEPGKEIMRGAMYVETWVPKQVRYPYPMLFIQGGGGQSNIALLQTPDGRPGWAHDFVNNGYQVFMIDFPGQGRSAYTPGIDPPVNPPRSGPLMEEAWTLGRPPSSEKSSWPQAKKYTQWPGSGKMGDPIFDYFAKTEVAHSDNQLVMQKHIADTIVELVDLINQPVIVVLHSGAAFSGWLVADARPKLVKAIIAAEPVAPPIENAERGATGPARLWGLTNFPMTYDPPAREASDLQTVREEKADGPELIPCWVQKEPARKLVNLQNIPVLNVAGEASYHRPYAHCVAKWLNQAGVKTTFVGLEEVGITGNNHQFLSEKNSADISKYFMSWLEKNVP